MQDSSAATNIIPWPKERAAGALRAARADQMMSQLDSGLSFVKARPAIILGVAALVGFLMGRLVGR